MGEPLKKSQLAQKVKERMGGNVGDLNNLLDTMINKCHKDNETRRGEEFIITQGEIKGYRKLQTLFTKQKKTS